MKPAHPRPGLLRKGRQHVTGIQVVVDGDQSHEPPFAFQRVRVLYVVSGHHLNETKVRRAVELSERRYCSVIGTIRGVAQVSCDVQVRESPSGGTNVETSIVVRPAD